MHIKRILFIWILIFPIFVFCQKKIYGVVKDVEGNFIPSASITIQEIGKQSIIAYGISNSNGEFNIEFSTLESEIEVKIKAFNYRTLIKRFQNENHKNDFTLETEVIEIQEIKLKTQIITKRGDTISYNLNSFDNKSDRTLSDVLKKIPGINVNEDGSILYQGNLINKFYVNGKDLMEGSYGTINNSLPKEDVLKVEVLENHQPVKILQDNIVSEQAAINIKLKKKISLTGRGELGAGYSNSLLWNAKLTPMFFGQKNQWVVNYKTNNLGESVDKEDKLLSFGNSWEGKRIQVIQNEWLNTEKAIIPNLPEKRYLMNNVHYFSVNLLTNPFKNKEWELKINSNYTNNEVSRTSDSDIFYFQSNNIVINKIYNLFYTNKFKTELVFIKNAKKGFFKNISTFSRFWNIQKADTQLNNITANQRVESPSVSLQNSLSAIVPWKHKMLNVKSYFNYQIDNQLLKVEPKDYVFTLSNLVNSNVIYQDFEIKTFQAEHSINLGFSKNYWTFTPEFGLGYLSNLMSSNLNSIDLTIANSIDFSNDISYNYLNPYTSIDINFKKQSWMFYFKLPVNFNNIEIDDSLRNSSKSFSKLTFEPITFVQYSFASHWKASAQSSINYNFGEINSVYSGNILLNPLSLSRMNPNNALQENVNKNLNIKLEFRDPFTNLFFNGGNRNAQIKRNLIITSNIINGAREISFENMPNNTFSNTLYGEFGKYFSKIKTNSSINYGYTNSNGQQKYNGSLKDVETNNQNVTFKLNNTFFKWMSCDYNFTYKWTKQFGFSDYGVTNRGLIHKLNLFLYPIENHSVGFDWDQINSTDTNSNYKNSFFDLSYQFTYVKRKIDFEIKWLNITNRSVFETYDLNAFYESYSKIYLRPSQIVFSVKFNFK